MFNSILTFLTRKGISKASHSQMCLRGTWYCKKFNIRTSEWLHLGHQRATVLRSLSRTVTAERKGARGRAERSFPSKTSWHRPLAHGEWSLTLLNGGDGLKTALPSFLKPRSFQALSCCRRQRRVCDVPAAFYWPWFCSTFGAVPGERLVPDLWHAERRLHPFLLEGDYYKGFTPVLNY